MIILCAKLNPYLDEESEGGRLWASRRQMRTTIGGPPEEDSSVLAQDCYV